MFTKQVTKLLQNLEKKKFRDKYNLFKIEGSKLVKELLVSDIKTTHLYGYGNWISNHSDLIGNREHTVIQEKEMKTISNFSSLPDVIALAHIPSYTPDNTEISNSLSLVLNGVQDPGNLGTIIRIADWFGVRNIFCDHDCASFHNPKCVQASMGAVFRVKIFYTDLAELLKKRPAPDFYYYGTFLNGNNIYKTTLYKKGFIIMGNEGNGISPELEKWIDHKLTIPSFAENQNSTESLNVSVATGIILSEFKRQHLTISNS